MILEEKKEIRRKIKCQLADYKNNFQKDSEAILNKVLESSEYKNADTILTYMALPDEVNLNIKKLSSNKNIFIPKVRIDDGEMDFFKYSEENLEKGAYNIIEPKSLSTTARSPSNLNDSLFNINAPEQYGNILIIVPGRAFTAEGWRLGRGKGYYDKFFQKLFSNFEKAPEKTKGKASVRLVGVCFPPQLVDYIPTDKFDVKMDKIISVK